jgi:hypothetical protein
MIRAGSTGLRTGQGSASGNVDQIHNAVTKARAQVVVLECLREPEPLWSGVSAKGHQMHVYFASYPTQLGVLVLTRPIVNVDQDVFDGFRHD